MGFWSCRGVQEFNTKDQNDWEASQTKCYLCWILNPKGFLQIASERRDDTPGPGRGRVGWYTLAHLPYCRRGGSECFG